MKRMIELYNDYRKRLKAFEYIEWLIAWDQETEAPEQSSDFRAIQVETLSEERYRIIEDSKYIEVIEKLYDQREALDELLRVEIELKHKELRIVKKVPKKKYIDYQVLLAKSSDIWAKAKQQNDFAIFEPVLEEIIKYNRQLVKYLETEEMKGYDVLLDLYEPGMTVAFYDDFFNQLKEELIPFVRDATIRSRYKFNKKLKTNHFPIEQQEAFSKYLIEVFDFDLTRGVLKESKHPSTSGVHSKDLRISTEYEAYNFTSNIFSTIHEMGHGIYGQQCDDALDQTWLYGGASIGMHESQSRMYENMIGRSFAFWKKHYPKLVSLFPKQLKGIDTLEFYKYINQIKRSLIRVDADELTYSLHIMARYEIEKDLIEGNLKVKDLPKKWRQLMMRYVGVRPVKDTEGVLQDIHWAVGFIGYFPTYALGSAYAAQIYQAMNQDFNVESAIENGNIKRINEWLKFHIHQYGKTKTPRELLKVSTNEDFNPKYYIEYLKRKYTQL